MQRVATYTVREVMHDEYGREFVRAIAYFTDSQEAKKYVRRNIAPVNSYYEVVSNDIFSFHENRQWNEWDR